MTVNTRKSREKSIRVRERIARQVKSVSRTTWIVPFPQGKTVASGLAFIPRRGSLQRSLRDLGVCCLGNISCNDTFYADWSGHNSLQPQRREYSRDYDHQDHNRISAGTDGPRSKRETGHDETYLPPGNHGYTYNSASGPAFQEVGRWKPAAHKLRHDSNDN